MTNEKKPSIYDDRGAIGSSDELDKYGVWVKSDPQVLSPPGKEDDPSAAMVTDVPDADDFDLAIPEIDDLPDIDIPALEESPFSGENDLPDFAEAGNTSPDDFDLPDMEEESTDSDNFDLPDTESADIPDFGEFRENEPDEESEDGNVFNFGDLTGQIDSLETDTADGDSFDLTESDELPDREIPAAFEDNETVKPDFEESVSGGEDGDFTELPADDFSGSLDSGDSPDDMDISLEEPNEDTGKSASSSDLSTQLLMKIAEELSSIRTELSTLKKEFSGIKSASLPPKNNEEKEEDDKISLTGEELINIMNTADFTQEAGVDATSVSPEDFEPEELPVGELEETGDAGFFGAGEDADEPGIEINLEDTGAGEDEPEIKAEEPLEETLSPDISPLDGVSDDFDISLENVSDEDINLELDSDGVLSENVFETAEEFNDAAILDDVPDELPELETGPVELDLAELGIGEEPEKEEAGGDSGFGGTEESFPDFEEEDDELRQLREDGAQPMTPAPSPEDAEYLTADSEAESIDLSEAVIEEPDLSLELQDNPLEEPSLEDISIDLDLTELETGEKESTDDETAEALGFEDIPDFSDSEETLDPFEEEPEVSADFPGEEISLPAETGEDFAETADIFESDIPLVDFDEDETEPAESGISPELETFETESGEASEDGGDLALIPEKFIEESGDLSVSEDSADTDKSDASGETRTPPGETEEITAPPVSGRAKASESGIPSHLKQELKTVLSYMDQLLESLPDEKIEEFARSEYYDSYKKVFKELGLV